MSQYKQIAFLQAGEPVLQMVDLSRLSPQAKVLAAAVNSTISYEDDSVVYIQSNQTNEQYWLEIAEHGEPRSFFSQAFAAYMAAEYQSGKYRNDRDAHPTQMYLWDGLRLTETPEQYFERHSRFIQEHGWMIVS